jgi:hypothetical protein
VGKTAAVTIEAAYFPDPRYQLVVDPKASGLSDDTIDIKTENGLLKSISTTYADKTVDVVKDIAEAGIKAFQMSHGIIPTKSTERTLGASETKNVDEPFVIDLHFDPFDESQLRAAREKLKTKEIVLDFRNIVKGAFSRYSDVPGDPGRVYYKPMQPYQVALYCANQKVWFSRTVLLPNESPIVSFQLKRAMFVERKTVIGFNDGVLTSVNDVKPSEVKALTGLVNDLVDKAVALMPIQIKIDQSKARASLLTQDTTEKTAAEANLQKATNLLDAEKAYQDKIRELEEAARAREAAEAKKSTERAYEKKAEEVKAVSDQLNAISDEKRRAIEENEKLGRENEALKKENEKLKKN